MSGKTVQKHLKRLESSGDVVCIERSVYVVFKSVIRAGRRWQVEADHGNELERTLADVKRQYKLRRTHARERLAFRRRRQRT